MSLPGAAPSSLVANLPYSGATQVLLRFLERVDSIRHALVMVQAEVAARLVAPPGSRTYGVPSAKLAWWAEAHVAGRVPRNAFFQVPRVDSELVYLERRPPPLSEAPRERVFALIDAAFAARRKTLRAALAAVAGGSDRAAAALARAAAGPLPPDAAAGPFPPGAARFELMLADALAVDDLGQPAPSALVSNLPYSVATKVLLRFLERFGSLRHGLVMVQAEVAARLVAPPGSKAYGLPSAKLAWWAAARPAGRVARNAFFPVPRVDSELVYFERRPPPAADVPRSQVFALVDAAFASRRKMLRSALAALAGGSARAEAALLAAGLDPTARGETLGIGDFARLARHLEPR
ncbi:MAG: hypothetical protein LBD51_09765 [Bifidobacteriaceae bacterium]|nr:hypothetical protein [Bifidobacteriaceae bacterium]